MGKNWQKLSMNCYDNWESVGGLTSSACLNKNICSYNHSYDFHCNRLMYSAYFNSSLLLQFRKRKSRKKTFHNKWKSLSSCHTCFPHTKNSNLIKLKCKTIPNLNAYSQSMLMYRMCAEINRKTRYLDHKLNYLNALLPNFSNIFKSNQKSLCLAEYSIDMNDKVYNKECASIIEQYWWHGRTECTHCAAATAAILRECLFSFFVKENWLPDWEFVVFRADGTHLYRMLSSVCILCLGVRTYVWVRACLPVCLSACLFICLFVYIDLRWCVLLPLLQFQNLRLHNSLL